MNFNKKVTAEQMKGYESTLTQEQGEAQLREDARASFTKAMLEGQAKQKRSEILTEIIAQAIVVAYVVFVLSYVISNI